MSAALPALRLGWPSTAPSGTHTHLQQAQEGVGLASDPAPDERYEFLELLRNKLGFSLHDLAHKGNHPPSECCCRAHTLVRVRTIFVTEHMSLKNLANVLITFSAAGPSGTSVCRPTYRCSRYATGNA